VWTITSPTTRCPRPSISSSAGAADPEGPTMSDGKKPIVLLVVIGATEAGTKPSPPARGPRPGPDRNRKESKPPGGKSDSTVVAAGVYRPADPATAEPAAGTFPVLLAITPHTKSSTTTTEYASDYGAGGDGRYGASRS